MALKPLGKSTFQRDDIHHKLRKGWPKKPFRPMTPEMKLAVKASIHYLENKRREQEAEKKPKAEPDKAAPF